MSIEPERLIYAGEEIRDRSGRAFLPEGNSPVYKQSRIPEREHTRTDMHALKEFYTSWNDSLQLISFYRGVYLSPSLSLGALNELSCGLSWLPVYLRLRASDPIGTNTLPVSVLDTARASAGVLSATQNMLLDDVSPTTDVSAHQLYVYANGRNVERTNLFVNQGKISCPAPEKTVVQVVDAMLHSPQAEAASQSVTDWSEVITEQDIAPSLLFGCLYMDLQTKYAIYKKKKSKITKRRLENQLDKLRQQILPVLGYTEAA